MPNRLASWLGLEDAAAGQAMVLRLAQALTGERPPPPPDDPLRAAFCEAADAHGVAGLLASCGPDLEQVALAHRAKNIRALRFTVRACQALEEAKIPHAVLKGAAAASRWSEPSARRQSDLDVLVRRQDLGAASETMVRASLSSHQFIAGEHLHNASLQPKDPGGLMIELHHSLNSSHEVTLSTAELLERRVRVETAQGAIWALEKEDDAVFLALHAATHALHRLAWLVDLWRLGVAGVQWGVAAGRAREGNVAIPVEVAWRRTRQLFGVAIPEAAFDELRVSVAERLRTRALFKLAHATQGPAQVFFERSYRMALVPLLDAPKVLRQKLLARREEAEGYASAARAAVSSPAAGAE